MYKILVDNFLVTLENAIQGIYLVMMILNLSTGV